MKWSYSNPRASRITFIARRRIWSMFSITWILSTDEQEIGRRLLWSWYAWRAYFCLSSWSLVMAGGIWERSWSVMSIAWFTRLSFCRRWSRSASSLALFLKMLACVSFRDLISPTADSAKSLKSSLCLMTFSCWRRSASCFWALLNCARWLSMKAAGVNASSIDSGSLPSSSSKMVRIGCAFLISWPMSWFRNWRDSWSLALISSDNTTESADVASSPSSQWLQFEKKTDYCLEILVPDREMWLGWLMKAKGWWNRPRGRMLTCFRHISSMLEPAGMRSCDEEHGIVMSGWSDSAWSASWRMIVRIYIMYLWASSEVIPVSMENLLWISWEPKVNAVPDKNQRKMMPNPGLWENLNTCWVSRIIPEHLMMYEEVY